MGYIVVEKNLRTGEVTRRGAHATDQEARLALANALEALYERNGDRPQILMLAAPQACTSCGS